MLSEEYADNDASPTRLVHINDPIKNQQQKFLHNGITTGKYNPFTFIPKFFYEQFSKYANLFFLFIAIIQQIGDLSPTNKFGTVIPLSIVLAVSAAKEILEDIKRHAQDIAVNNRLVSVLFGTSFVPKKWREVTVGDIVRIENGSYFPADLILLSSSEPDGLCYIETSNLDGETNLKIRQGRPETTGLISPDQIASLEGSIRTELPNNSLYTFEGTLRLKGKESSLDPDQLLLRGAMLRNTRWVYGIVVFTGHETKLMKNATATPIKRSHIDKVVNGHIIYLFFILVSMSLLCAFGTLYRELTNNFESTILFLNPNTAWVSLPGFFLTYIILFNNLIPMSLLVTLEIVRFFLGMLINMDEEMYHEPVDTPATARTSSLVEELGQINYVFSDKTGTLTCNMMEFRMCSIAGNVYTDNVPDNKRISTDENGKITGWYDFKALKEHDQSSVYSQTVREFLQLLATCHTVIPETSEEDPEKVVFQASSPDEGALVKGAEILGYAFRIRRPRSVVYVKDEKEYEWEILQINEFNSTRKRMSALVRGPDGQVKLYIKGADTVILERLSKANNPYVDSTCVHLEEYANIGLRTLCIAYRDVPEDEYQNWAKIYEKAANTINNRAGELETAAELIEKDLILLGATAIEDRLQDQVPETIHTLATAGIRLWVLTGDRQETAINIGYSCKLITDEMSLIICNEKTHFETKEFLEQKLIALKGTENMAELEPEWWQRYLRFPYSQYLFRDQKKLKMTTAEPEALALIIDGKSLSFALEDDVKMIFLELATMCQAVICCRVSPLQKALVVKLVKKNVKGAVTLAIGDGANDVSMIQAAHVGVGISGMEGLQAARAADFAIAQFRFLQKLLLVHGGWAYSRISKVVLYSFYKNITLYLIQLWFTLDNGFSGQTLFETWTQSAYNIIFAFFQPLAIGVFDQYVNARMLNRYPALYKYGQRNEFYNRAAAYGEGIINQDGGSGSNWLFGEIVYTADLIVITLKAALIVDSWVKFSFFAIGGSIALWFCLFPIYSLVGPMVGVGSELEGLNQPMFGSAVFWFAMIIVPMVCNMRDYAWKYFKRTAKPKSYHIVQELQKYNIPDFAPRLEVFKKAMQKIRLTQRQKRQRGFAFSQNEDGQAQLIRIYDTTSLIKWEIVAAPLRLSVKTFSVITVQSPALTEYPKYRVITNNIALRQEKFSKSRSLFLRTENNGAPLFGQSTSDIVTSTLVASPTSRKRDKIPKEVQKLCDKANNFTKDFLENQELIDKYQPVQTVSSDLHWIICIVERRIDSKQFLIKKIDKLKIPDKEKYFQPCDGKQDCTCAKCSPHQSRPPIDLILLKSRDNGLPQLVEYVENDRYFYLVTKLHGVSQKRWRHVSSWFGSSRYAHVNWGEFI